MRAARTLVVDVEPCQQVAALKAAVEAKEGVPAEEQRLVFAGLELEDARTLAEYGLVKESTVDLVLRLEGSGGKKRKKKVYTKPKRIPHKHKTVKLATLKFYKVDDKTNKVTRLRKECHMESCGAGVFMAAHFDRYTCGRCSATYMIQGKGE